MNLKIRFFDIILLVTAGLTCWLIWLTANNKHTAPLSDNESDAFAKQIQFKQFDQDGKLKYQLETPLMVHYAYDNHTDVSTPDYTIINKEGSPWKITAARGRAESGMDVIHLYKDVVISRAPSSDNKATTLTTEEASYHPEDNSAKTDSLVDINQPGLTVSAKGMIAYFDENNVKLLSNVQGNYEPDKY